MTGPPDADALREQAMGARLAEARAVAGISIRRAARISGIPPVRWADMERGERSGGGRIAADDAAVAKAAAAVGIDPADLFAALGRDAASDLTPVEANLAATVAQLEARLRRTEAALALLAQRVGLTPDELWAGGSDPGR